jgi:DNA-binding transcriptional regulator PaaX
MLAISAFNELSQSITTLNNMTENTLKAANQVLTDTQRMTKARKTVANHKERLLELIKMLWDLSEKKEQL